ncbi:alkyldihydroxyacetonephosphate synthase-like [Diaphorina citri]|uniref:Alkylglycerone-phosphate synthase n=1 Tax=Diaphorina citri TaxID=121845 RepID=A0A1S4ED87_DIACI|nr:alkyldihydroxyacetonephosphate synthase-like [Diaphorina citri]
MSTSLQRSVLSLLEDTGVSLSTEGEDRLYRSHGQTNTEIYQLKYTSIMKRMPDVVMWPESTEDVEKVVQVAHDHNLVIIPFGGGTNVTGAVACPENELRTIISLDTSQMGLRGHLEMENTQHPNEDQAFSEHAQSTVEQGTYAHKEESSLDETKSSRLQRIKVQSAIPKKRSNLLKWNGWGYRDTLFEDSDSIVVLRGGRYLPACKLPGFTEWAVKTFDFDRHYKRAVREMPQAFPSPKMSSSNIEDLLVQVTMVTARGTLERACLGPRVSCGPDFNHIVLGSEGTLGVITKVVLKIRPQPRCQKFGSILFPNFEAGVKCLREIAKKRCQPSSIRLVDNVQLKAGQFFRPDPGYLELLTDGLKKLYVTKILGFRDDEMCAATVLFEGDPEDVKNNEDKIYSIAKRYGGIPAGESNGRRGYMLTYIIAYIRDFACDYYFIGDSFETSVPWDKTVLLCINVKKRLTQECTALSIKFFETSCRVTQTYDAGSCIYFYFGFNARDFENPDQTLTYLQHCARDEIIACGGSLSHHHGVGKIRSHWYPEHVSQVGLELYRSTKQALDPNNVFASGNLLLPSDL